MADLRFIQIFQNRKKKKQKTKQNKTKKNQNIKLKFLYNLLLENPNKILNAILYFKDNKDQYEDICLKAGLMFDLRDEMFKKLSNKELRRVFQKEEN